MSELLPEGAACASHPEALASWTCGRCGSFLCTACERRTRPEARPMCPACWELRARTVPANQGRGGGGGLQTAGLVLGIFSLFPMCVAIQVASLVLNLVALSRVKEAPPGYGRWRPITGLVLTGVGVAATVLVALLG